MKLQLKPEYAGLVITKNLYAIGNVTFDADKVKQEHYENYSAIGFYDIFETIEENTKVQIINEGDKFIETIEDTELKVKLYTNIIHPAKEPKKKRGRKPKQK